MASSGTIEKKYVTGLSDFLDQREINQFCTDWQNNDFFSDILWFNNNKRVIETGQSVYRTAVNENVVLQIDTTGATISNNNTAQVTVTMASAALSVPAKVQDVIMTTDGRSGIIYSTSTSSGVDTYVIRTVDGGALSITAGNKLPIYSCAFGEKSGAPQALRYGSTFYFNKWQIFRVASSITDVQKRAKIELTFNGQPYWTYKDEIDKKIELKVKVNAAIFGGSMSNTTFTDQNPYLTDQNTATGGGGGAVQLTQGINRYIDLYGTALNPGTTMSFGAIDDAQDNLISKRCATKDFWLIGSSKARRKYDVFLKGLASSGVNSVRLTLDAASGSSLKFEVDNFSYGGFNMNFLTMPMLDDPTIFANNVVSKNVYWIPKDAYANIYGGGTQSAISIRYIPHGSKFSGSGADGLIGMTFDGALSDTNPKGSVLKDDWDMYTKQGVEWLTPNWGLKQQVLA